MATIAVLIGPEFEDSEYTGPGQAFRDAGHTLVHISSKPEAVEGKHGEKVMVDLTAEHADPADYNALFLPGGHSPDNLRADENVVEFTRQFVQTSKPILAICHGPQLLISADAVKGKIMTAWPTVQKDLELAGAWVKDEPVVVDGNLVTSRNPNDIQAFVESSLEILSEESAPSMGSIGAEA